jgi:pyruvate-formate lyase
VDGYEATAESWARDYAFLLDNSPAEIYENEYIVGEFHWEMNEIRRYEFPQEVYDLAKKARELGCGGTSHGHTCPDLVIGLAQGWGGILARIKQSKQKYERLHNQLKVSYLNAALTVCEAAIRYIQKHSIRALEMAKDETNAAQRKIYLVVAKCCANIAANAPGNYYEAVQWIQFNVMLDRIVGHGNGYGRLDQYLIGFYNRGIATGTLTREDARNYLAEMFLKLRGQFFCLGGRDREGRDATNEMSWVVLEAYDMIDDYNNLGVMWHPDMDERYYEYVCDVLARHGASVPSLVNYDMLRDAELRSGIAEDDAWNVAYSGCQWFCIPGKEYCDQDVNAFVLIEPLRRAIKAGIANQVREFEELYQIFVAELKRTARVMREFKNVQYDALPYIWPEILTSLNCHGPIERGLDMTAPRGVDVQFTSTNFLGIPNVTDSLFAIKKLVFEQKLYTLQEVADATKNNWKEREVMRQRFLNQDKYGNDLDEVDALYVRITESIAAVMDHLLNNRGQSYRASLFQFQGQTCPTVIGATSDGRYAEEFLAHGCNPTPGRNTKGLLATANSLAKVDNQKFQGGSLQIELQPKFFDGKEQMWKYIRDFSITFFKKGGAQINLNIMDLNELKKAIDHPEDPEYQNIIIKVTGYTTRFICLDQAFQKELVGRVNYEGL